MVQLGSISSSRDNNFNVIRAFAAFCVLVSHAYPIALGDGTSEPLASLTGYTLGTLAVYVFFILSGFLITASFERARNRTNFIVARFLRLFPGLLVSLLFVAFVLGPWVSDLSVRAYLGHHETWSFMLRNILLVQPQYNLPGVFTANPVTSIEGSIWTLFYEVACYIGVFVAGAMGLFKLPWRATTAIVLFLCFGLLREWVQIDFQYQIGKFVDLGAPFAIGALAWLWRHHIFLSIWGIFGAGLLAWALKGTAFYDLGLMVALAYALFWLGYIPGGWIRKYNAIGDYSYGIYIYAFPMQGLAIWLFGPMSAIENILIATPLTVLPAIVSWHFVEKPAMAARETISRWLMRSSKPAV